MPNVRTFVSYVRDQQGNGITDALVQAYAITNLSTNAKGVSPLAETYPSSSGRWTLNVDLDNSPTGFVSIKISRGDTVRWIEGDVVMQATEFMGEDGSVPIPSSSITDSHLGSRTINQNITPTSDSGTLTELLSSLASRILSITGESSWRTPAVITLRHIRDLFRGSDGHTHTGNDGDGPRLNPNFSLSPVPSMPGHNHDDRYYTHSYIDNNYYTRTASDNRYEFKGQSSGGGSVQHAQTADHANTATSANNATNATNANNLRNIDGRHFMYLWDALIPNLITNTGPHRMQIGTTVVTTNSHGSAWINYPRPFPNATRWIMVVNGGGGYRGAVNLVTSSRSNFEIRLQGDEARQIRVNWWAIGN